MSAPEVSQEVPAVFSVLRTGQRDPEGPFSEQDLLRLLNEKYITPDDLVYFEGMTQWQPIREIFEIQEQISHFVDDGQDRTRVAEAFREVSDLTGPGDNIYYIAVQERSGLLHRAKQCVVITDMNVYLLRQVKTGYEIEAHPWLEVSNTLMRDEGKDLATYSILLGHETRVDIPHIPMRQVQRLFQLSQEMKQASLARS